MRSAALFDLLPDFGASLPRAVPVDAAREHAARSDNPPVDIEAIVARAVADAEAALEERLTKAHEEALEAERQANAQEAKLFLESLGDDVGKTIAARIDAAQSHLGELAGTAVTRIVGGLLSEDLQKRSVTALARTIRDSIGDPEAVRIAVRGPQSLFETLSAALGAYADHLDFTEASSLDLTVVIDDAVFETRMAEWGEALTEVLL
ncbi:MAG TPA: hypothetical protein VGM46_03705 [Mesorhizobium sp.]